MSDGLVHIEDERFAPLADEDHSAVEACATEPDDGETPILHPGATLPRRIHHPRLGFPSTISSYRADSGDIWALECRFDKPNRKKEFAYLSLWRRADGSEHWRWKCPPGLRPLYKLPDVVARTDAPVMICEGGKATDAAALAYSDHVTTCWPGGANAVRLTDFSPLAGRHVTIFPDNDEPGRKAATELIKILLGLGCKLDVIDAERLSAVLPDHPDETRQPVPKWDAADAVGEWTDYVALRQATARFTRPVEAPPGYRSHGRFTMTESGLAVSDRSSPGGDGAVRVSAPFEVVGRTRSPDGGEWGRLLRWRDPDGRCHEVLIFDEELHGNTAPLVAKLTRGGLVIERQGTAALADYLNGCVELPPLFTVRRTGWHDLGEQWVFVISDASFGEPAGQRVIFVGGSGASYQAAGSLGDWSSTVGRLVRGHSRPMLMVSAAFAAVLLAPTGRDGGGLSFFGQSSIGKTVALMTAASVWGMGSTDGYIHTWCGTTNGLEAAAARYNGMPFCIDELGQADPRDIGGSIYKLLSGAGKIRATQEGTLRTPQSWKTFVLSTGEMRLGDKLREDGRRPMAGQLVRLLEVRADAGCGFGAFDHGGDSGNAKDLADALKHAARTSYGTAGPEFVRRLMEKGLPAVVREVEANAAEFARDHVPPGADGQVRRAADTFALVGYAGELATALGILPWQAGDALGAAVTCFEAWLEDRGGVGSHEVPEAIERIRSFVARHGSSRFETFPAAGASSSARPIVDRAGYRRAVGAEVEWLFFPGVWKDEVLRELDTGTTRRALIDKGVLRSNGKHQCVVKVSGKSERFYVVRLQDAGAADREGDEPLLI